MSRAFSSSLAGFQVTTIGRFWVTAEAIGDIPPAEFEQMYYQQQQSRLVEAGLN